MSLYIYILHCIEREHIAHHIKLVKLSMGFSDWSKAEIELQSGLAESRFPLSALLSSGTNTTQF